MSGFADENGSSKDPKMLMVNRMHARHAILIDGFRHAISDSSVLHLGAEDGRWCYTFAAAGALEVVGVEENAHLVSRFDGYPDIGLRERIDLRCAAPFKELNAEVMARRQYDVIALFDVLEETSDLHLVFHDLRNLKPRLIIGDCLVTQIAEPVLMLIDDANRPGLRMRPSSAALEVLARDAGFELEWLDWKTIPEEGRLGLDDYYTIAETRRVSFIMTMLRAD